MERHGTQWQEHTELRMVWHANFLEFLESSKDNCGKFPEAFWSITRCIYRAHIPRQKRQNKSNSPLLSLCNRFRSYRCESDMYHYPCTSQLLNHSRFRQHRRESDTFPLQSSYSLHLPWCHGIGSSVLGEGAAVQIL